MFVKFGMDTEQIVANATNIIWMHSFISGHKKVEYIFRNHVSIAHVTVFITRQYPESQSYCSSLMIDSWSTASDARQSRQGETVSFGYDNNQKSKLNNIGLIVYNYLQFENSTGRISLYIYIHTRIYMITFNSKCAIWNHWNN